MQKLMQIKEYLLEIAFVLLLIKLLVPGAGFPEAVGMVIVVISMAYNKFLSKEKYTKEEEWEKRISDAESKVSSLLMKESMKRAPNEEIGTISTSKSKRLF